MRPDRLFKSLLLAGASLLAACQTPVPEQGTWSGTVSIGPERTIPLRMELDFRSTPPRGEFLVGEERTVIPELRLDGDSLILSISEYKAAIRARWDGSRFVGRYERYRSDTTGLEFTAWPEGREADAGRAAVSTTPGGVRLSGNFRVYAAGKSGIDSTSTATFRIKGDSVFGTIIAPDGDYGLMAGRQQGSTVVLNRFTGWQISQLELHGRGAEWDALYRVRNLAAQELTLRPLAAGEPAVPAAGATTMKDPLLPFAFSGVTSGGDTLRHTDERFRGKVLVLDIMGTWCHNCLDAAPVLQQLFEQFGPEGLEVVGLAFEISDDADLARKNLSLYSNRHGITFPLLFCGSLDAANVQLRIKSQLENFGAYPTSIFVGRDGRVRSIHMGFNGPGTGDAYQAQISRYWREVQELLVENVR